MPDPVIWTTDDSERGRVLHVAVEECLPLAQQYAGQQFASISAEAQASADLMTGPLHAALAGDPLVTTVEAQKALDSATEALKVAAYFLGQSVYFNGTGQ